MRRQILIVAENGSAIPHDLLDCLPAGDCRQTDWRSFSSSGSGPPADLLLLMGVPDPGAALGCLRELGNRRGTSIVIAVLPGELGASELAIASELADEFILWPQRPAVVRERIVRLCPWTEAQEAYENLTAELGRANLVGEDPCFLRMAAMIQPSARTPLPVLITGETGTGKELIARAIHFMSARRNGPFIPVDCGGIPEHLFENELFGHVRGAYTDAHTEQRGLAGMADHGTLFLDEVDSLGLGSQVKLLRFLQERQYKPLGSERYVCADAKIVAATNRDLRPLVAEGRFRQDLHFRLDVLRLDLPPLRERREDIPRLARHFLELYSPAGARKTIAPSAMAGLMSYHWPGNIRQLLNVVQRAIVYSQGRQIGPGDIELPRDAPPPRDFQHARRETIQGFEREYVEKLLRRHAGNVTQAAREAGKERRAFGKLVKKYGLGQQARAAGQS